MIRAFSADSHVTEPGDCYIDRIDPKFRDRAPVAVLDDTMGATILIDNGRNRLPYGMVAAACRPWDQISPFQTTHLMNHERLMWASDHPDSDATFPDSQAVLAEQTAALEPTVRDDIVWRNCARLYGLDA